MVCALKISRKTTTHTTCHLNMPRPAKRKRNITNLRNQPGNPTNLSASSPEHADSDSGSDVEDFSTGESDLELQDSLKMNPSRIDNLEDGVDKESDWEELENEEFLEEMLRLAEQAGDDARDEDWVPQQHRRKPVKSKVGRPKGVLNQCNKAQYILSPCLY